MKKKLVLTLSLLAIAILSGCSNTSREDSISPSELSEEDSTEDSREEKNGFSANANTTTTFFGYDISIPSYWKFNEDISDLSTETYYAETGNSVSMLQLKCMSSPFSDFEDFDNQKEEFIESFGNSFDSFDLTDISSLDISNFKGLLFVFSSSSADINYDGRMFCFVSESSNNFIGITLLQSDNTDYNYFSDYEKILNSITPSSGLTGAEPAEEESSDEPEIPFEYQNALSKAHDYLSFTSFSYSGLIDQLEYEEFSTEAATYAADNCGADWNEQAAMKAQSYMDFSSFSRQGLIDQLLYEGFTQEQAEYGATAVGY